MDLDLDLEMDLDMDLDLDLEMDLDMEMRMDLDLEMELDMEMEMDMGLGLGLEMGLGMDNMSAFLKELEKANAEASKKLSENLNRVMFGLTKMIVVDTTPQNGCSHKFLGMWEGQGNFVKKCRICLVEQSSRTYEVYCDSGEPYLDDRIK